MTGAGASENKISIYNLVKIRWWLDSDVKWFWFFRQFAFKNIFFFKSLLNVKISIR